MKTITACTLDCPDSCSLLVEAVDNGRSTIRGNPDHPYTRGFTCPKIKTFARRLNSPNRITVPMIKEGSKWRHISWEAALDRCAEYLQMCRTTPGTLLNVHGSGDNGLVARSTNKIFASLGSIQVAAGQLCNAAGSEAFVADFGKMEQSEIQDLLNARTIVNWGRDLSRSWPHLSAMVSKARSQSIQVVSITPGGDDNGRRSDFVIRIRPGTDRFLAAAVIRTLFERGLVKKELLQKSLNHQAFRKLLTGVNVKELIRHADVKEKDVDELVRIYGGSLPVASIVGWGLQRYRYGGQNVRFINALAFLSGNIGRTGGGSYYLAPTKGKLNLSFLDELTARPPRIMPFPLIGREITQADPPIKMIWTDCSNFVNQAPDSNGIVNALKKVEFKVVVDAYMTDTAEQADMFLPCALMLEKEDLITSTGHNFINYVRPAFNPPGLARSDHWILSEVCRRLDPPIEVPTVSEHLRAALDVSSSKVSLEDLREKGFVRADRPSVAYADGRTHHERGFFHLPETLDEEPTAPDGYPLRLLSLSRREKLHSQFLPEDHTILPSIWVSPENSFLPTLDFDRPVYLVSPLGKLRVRLETLEGLHPEAVVYRRGDWKKFGGGINQIISAGVADMGDMSAYYQQNVRLEN